ncbi:MAG: hypothetical protein HQ483_03680 [Rhodospirillales bacterium]|nr:hypothetical protein [Rhodospirillales bacterium]
MGNSLIEATSQGWSLVLTYVPNLFGAVILLIVG